MPSLREKTQLMSASEMDRTLVRLAHEILEKSPEPERLAFIGIKRRGVPIAQRLAQKIEALEGRKIPVGTLDIQLYRDDLSTVGPRPVVGETPIGFAVKSGARPTAGADRPRPPRTADRSAVHGPQGADLFAGNRRGEISRD